MAMSVGVTQSALSGLAEIRKDKNEENENVWTKILAEVQSTERNKLPSFKSLLVLGDSESGKTTLVAKLQCNEDPKKGSGLEYAYIDVRDEYRDEHTRLSVWVLDGDPRHSELLQFGVNGKSLEHTVVLLTVSMETPWTIMDQLQIWASTLHEHLDSLKLEHDEVQRLQDKMTYAWQSYVEPGDELDGCGAASPLKPQPPVGAPGQGAGQRTSRNLEEEALFLPLPEGVLSRNLGVPIIVVVTKTDYMATLEKEFDYKEEHFDFVQQSIRKFCLQYGASLFYTSVKEDKNCDLLYKYLVHRIYNFPFRTPALVVEKDAVFIPAGWDNEKKISILFENLHTMTADDYYSDVIVKPPTLRKAVVREVEVCAEDEQQFLSRHHNQLSAGTSPLPPTAGAALGPAVSRSPAAGGVAQTPPGQKVPERRVSSNASPGQMASPKKLDPSKPGVPGANEGVLANFFNSLLNKKTATVPAAAAATVRSPNDKAAMRSDAAAELDRLTRSATKPLSPAQSMNLNNSADLTSQPNSTTDC